MAFYCQGKYISRLKAHVTFEHVKDSLKKGKLFGNWLWWNPCSVPGIMSSSKSPPCDDFRANRTNCYCGEWVLHVVLPLTSCDFCSQILSVYERSIEVFFFHLFWLFLLQKAEMCWHISKNVHFSSSLGRSMETSRRNTTLRHRDNVHVYDKWPVWG